MFLIIPDSLGYRDVDYSAYGELISTVSMVQLTLAISVVGHRWRSIHNQPIVCGPKA